MYIIDSTYFNSCFEAIPVGLQITYYIYNISNKISHFHGKWWKCPNNTICTLPERQTETDGGGGGERELLWGEKKKSRKRRKKGKEKKKEKTGKLPSLIRWLTMPGNNY